MLLSDWIVQIVTERFSPVELSVEDESDRHAGHAGARPGEQTHLRIDVVSEAFVGKSRVERHRMVNDAVGEAFGRQGLHALAIRARTPGETGAA